MTNWNSNISFLLLPKTETSLIEIQQLWHVISAQKEHKRQQGMRLKTWGKEEREMKEEPQQGKYCAPGNETSRCWDSPLEAWGLTQHTLVNAKEDLLRTRAK